MFLLFAQSGFYAYFLKASLQRLKYLYWPCVPVREYLKWLITNIVVPFRQRCVCGMFFSMRGQRFYSVLP